MKYVSLIVGILIILLVVAGGVLLWQRQPAPVEPTPIEPTEPTEPTKPIEPTTPQEPDVVQVPEGWRVIQTECKAYECKRIEAELKKIIDAKTISTSNWKIYNNIENEFRLEYPSSWVLLDKNHPQFGKLVQKETISFLSPESFNSYFMNPPVGITERYIDILAYTDKHNSAEQKYKEYMREGFQDKIFISLDFKEGLKAFMYNTVSGSVIISIPKGEEFSLNFSIELFDGRMRAADMTVIKTIINSLEFEN